MRKIWENEKTGMLPVSQDVFMDKVWAIERERVVGIETLVEAEIEIEKTREGEKERDREDLQKTLRKSIVLNTCQKRVII